MLTKEQRALLDDFDGDPLAEPGFARAIRVALRTIDAQREEIDSCMAAVELAVERGDREARELATAAGIPWEGKSHEECVALVAAQRARIAALEAENAALRSVGTRMSNVCFNLSQLQGELRIRDRDLMRDLARQWDALRKVGK